MYYVSISFTFYSYMKTKCVDRSLFLFLHQIIRADIDNVVPKLYLDTYRYLPCAGNRNDNIHRNVQIEDYDASASAVL